MSDLFILNGSRKAMKGLHPSAPVGTYHLSPIGTKPVAYDFQPQRDEHWLNRQGSRSTTSVDKPAMPAIPVGFFSGALQMQSAESSKTDKQVPIKPNSEQFTSIGVSFPKIMGNSSQCKLAEPPTSQTPLDSASTVKKPVHDIDSIAISVASTIIDEVLEHEIMEATKKFKFIRELSKYREGLESAAKKIEEEVIIIIIKEIILFNRFTHKRKRSTWSKWTKSLNHRREMIRLDIERRKRNIEHLQSTDIPSFIRNPPTDRTSTVPYRLHTFDLLFEKALCINPDSM